MRTAVTLAKKHDGKEVLVFGRQTPVEKQKANINRLQGERSHDTYQEVTYQESDGGVRTLRFQSAADYEKEQAAIAESEAEAKKLRDAQELRIARKKQEDAERLAKEHKERADKIEADAKEAAKKEAEAHK